MVIYLEKMCKWSKTSASCFGVNPREFPQVSLLISQFTPAVSNHRGMNLSKICQYLRKEQCQQNIIKNSQRMCFFRHIQLTLLCLLFHGKGLYVFGHLLGVVIYVWLLCFSTDPKCFSPSDFLFLLQFFEAHCLREVLCCKETKVSVSISFLSFFLKMCHTAICCGS